MLPMLWNRLIPTFADQSLLGDWSALRRKIDRMFDDASGDLMSSSWVPAMDVAESADAVRLTFEVPGVNPADLKLTLENGVLTVSGEKLLQRDLPGEGGRTHGVERRYGTFERSLMLPQALDFEQVSARCENGVLIVEIAKASEARPRSIQIASGPETRQIGSGTDEQRNVA